MGWAPGHLPARDTLRGNPPTRVARTAACPLGVRGNGSGAWGRGHGHHGDGVQHVGLVVLLAPSNRVVPPGWIMKVILEGAQQYAHSMPGHEGQKMKPSSCASEGDLNSLHCVNIIFCPDKGQTGCDVGFPRGSTNRRHYYASNSLPVSETLTHGSPPIRKRRTKTFLRRTKASPGAQGPVSREDWGGGGTAGPPPHGPRAPRRRTDSGCPRTPRHGLPGLPGRLSPDPPHARGKSQEIID